MSDALVPMNDARRVVENLPADLAPTLEEYAAALNLSTGQVAGTLTNKDVAHAIQELTKARALLALGPTLNRLIQIINTGEAKEAMQAAGLLLRLSGAQKPTQVNVKLSFDELVKKAGTAEPGPLSGITQIREAEAIDAFDTDDDYNDE